MKKTLHFSIEGEWLTEVARQKYWYEEEPYEKVFAWLKNCLCPCDGSESEAFSEQVDRIVDGILKGELKLVGVNQFDAKEDNAQEEYNAKIREGRNYQGVCYSRGRYRFSRGSDCSSNKENQRPN